MEGVSYYAFVGRSRAGRSRPACLVGDARFARGGQGRSEGSGEKFACKTCEIHRRVSLQRSSGIYFWFALELTLILSAGLTSVHRVAQRVSPASATNDRKVRLKPGKKDVCATQYGSVRHFSVQA